MTPKEARAALAPKSCKVKIILQCKHCGYLNIFDNDQESTP